MSRDDKDPKVLIIETIILVGGMAIAWRVTQVLLWQHLGMGSTTAGIVSAVFWIVGIWAVYKGYLD